MLEGNEYAGQLVRWNLTLAVRVLELDQVGTGSRSRDQVLSARFHLNDKRGRLSRRQRSVDKPDTSGSRPEQLIEES
jgi:hypothetical protein